MTTYAVHPGARVLWCLRRRTSDVRCIAFLDATPIELRVLQDGDLVLTETFPTHYAGLKWAQEYHARLKEHGWHDSPDAGSGPGGTDVH